MATIDRTPWNALIDDSGQNLDGSIWNKAAIKTVLLDPIDAAIGPVATGAWTPYTPVWAGGDNVGPVLGNGVLGGRYVVIGKTCHFTVYLKPGSTTTFGSSSYWTWSLPVASVNLSNLATGGIAGMINPGGGPSPPGISYALNVSTVYVIASTGGFVNPTVPFTWAAPNCTFYLRGTYETA